MPARPTTLRRPSRPQRKRVVARYVQEGTKNVKRRTTGKNKERFFDDVATELVVGNYDDEGHQHASGRTAGLGGFGSGGRSMREQEADNEDGKPLFAEI